MSVGGAEVVGRGRGRVPATTEPPPAWSPGFGATPRGGCSRSPSSSSSAASSSTRSGRRRPASARRRAPPTSRRCTRLAGSPATSPWPSRAALHPRPDRLQEHLLLLPQGVPPLLLLGPAGVRCARAPPRGLPRRDRLPLHPQQPPPLRAVRGDRLHPDPRVRRGQRLQPRRPPLPRAGDADHGGQRGAPRRLHVLLPLLPAHGRRQRRLLLLRPLRPPASLRLEAGHPAQHLPSHLGGVSLFSVWAVDLYVRMLNAGWFTDPHLLVR